MKQFIIFIILFNTLSICAESTFQNPDKVYLHLDRNLYAQGDTIWIKGYALQRGTHKPSNNSYTIHVQMINEDGIQVGAYKLLAVEGEAIGQIEILGVQEPGFYQLIAHTGYMKNFDRRFFYKTTIEIRERVRSRTINTLFDKSVYEVGDTAEVTFSVIDQNQNPVPKARFVYEYVQGKEVLSNKGVLCDKDGTITIKIPILGDKGENAKLEFSYFADDLDIHRKRQEVILPIKDNRIHLSFFPEGGDIIRGLMTKVAFKANDDFGKPVSIRGELYKDGESIADFSSIHQGMGLITFFPQQGDYTFKITSPRGIDSIYQLPQILQEGFKLSYRTQDKDKVYLTVAHNYGEEHTCKLWISAYDKLLSTYEITVDTETTIPIAKMDLPSGIVTFTISNAEGQPQAERLVYIEKPVSQLDLTVSQKTVETRQKVDVTLKVDDDKNARLSFAVIDSALSHSSRLQTSNIMAYATLESELKGYIYDVSQYIGSGRSVSNKRDLLLMTHGWRRFEWISNSESLSQLKPHNFDRVFGKVTRMGKPYAQANIGAYMLGSSIAFSEFEADDEGRFYLDPSYETRSYQDIMIVATNKRNRSGLKLDIHNTDTVKYSEVLEENADNLNGIRKDILLTEFKEEEIPRTIEEPFMTYHTLTLDEFEVSAENTTWDMSKYINSAREMKLGTDIEEFSSFDWLLLQVSNKVLLEGSMYDGSLLIDPHEDSSDITPKPIVKADRAIVDTHCADRPDILDISSCTSHRLDEIAIVFDGVHNPPGAMIYLNDEKVGYFVSTLDFLKKEDISAVVIFDGVTADQRFGIEAYYGAIMVYTYDKGIWNRNRLKSNKALYGEFVKARQFPTQLYENEEQSKLVGDDSRVLLHWEPLISTGEKGEANISFYTGDIPGKKKIVVQGFDDDGNLYYQSNSFMVKDIMGW